MDCDGFGEDPTHLTPILLPGVRAARRFRRPARRATSERVMHETFFTRRSICSGTRATIAARSPTGRVGDRAPGPTQPRRRFTRRASARSRRSSGSCRSCVPNSRRSWSAPANAITTTGGEAPCPLLPWVSIWPKTCLPFMGSMRQAKHFSSSRELPVISWPCSNARVVMRHLARDRCAGRCRRAIFLLPQPDATSVSYGIDIAKATHRPTAALKQSGKSR